VLDTSSFKIAQMPARKLITPLIQRGLMGRAVALEALKNLLIRQPLAGFGYQVALSQLKVPSTSMYHMTYAICCGQVIESA
jgi:hypothetical protein